MTYGNQFGGAEFPDDLVRLVALLLLHQLVTVEGDDALDFAAVQGFLVEFRVQLELDGRALECGHGIESVLVSLLDQLDGRADGVAHLTQDQADS